MTFEEWWADKTESPVSFNMALRMYGIDIVKPLVESAWVLGRLEGLKLTNAMHSDGKGRCACGKPLGVICPECQRLCDTLACRR